MADTNNNKGSERNATRPDYAPEWITKSIDKVPPSDEPLAGNLVVDAILGIEKPHGSNDESGNAKPPLDDADSSN